MLFFKPFIFMASLPLKESKALVELAVVAYDLLDGLAKREGAEEL